jgi:signal transduction histidine kinase
VKDNGIGIATKYHQQIFEPFKRLHGSEIPGTGIGLAMCRRIIEAQGGRIWVESVPGEGTTICMTFRAA